MLELQRLARDVLGVESELFAARVHPSLRGRARRHTDYGRRAPAHGDDVLVYHLALGSVVADFVGERPERLVVDYHNVTPPEFYVGWHPEAAYECHWGRAQLPRLAARASLGVAPSPYSERELREAGYARTATAPILLDVAELRGEGDGEALAALQADEATGGSRWLFVGRVAPNKCQHDVVKAFAAYRRAYDPDARLHLVGGPSSPSYWSAVERLAEAVGVGGAVRLAGSVTGAELRAHYRAADVFVCLSEHEGFCLPVVEAMAHELPVVAYAAAAVPGTMGEAGLLLARKEPATVAAAVHEVLSEPSLRDRLVEAGTRRVGDFALEATRARWVEVLRSLAAL